MTQNSSFIRQLEVSRRIGSQLNLQQHRQDLRRSKLQRQIQDLNKSRRNYVQSQILQTEQEYRNKLKEYENVSEEHNGRQKRSAAERARIAQVDFQRDRQRLLRQRNEHDQLDKQYRAVEKDILNLHSRSRRANEDQDRLLRQLNNRKLVVVKLIQESKQRQLYHYDQSKKLSSF